MTKRLGAPAAVLVLAVCLLLGSCAQGQGSKQAFCKQVRSLSDKSVLLGRFDPSDSESLSIYKESTAKEMAQLERAAPRDLKPDVANVTDLTEEVAQLVQKYGDNRFELQQRLYSLVRNRVGAASSVVKVANYAKSQCGVDINPKHRSGQDSGGSGGAPGGIGGAGFSSD